MEEVKQIDERSQQVRRETRSRKASPCLSCLLTWSRSATAARASILYRKATDISSKEDACLTCARFPPPKIFTNALLSNHDITSLIRDTESHERALFSVPPPPPPTSSVPKPGEQDASGAASSGRRRTVFNVASGEVTTGPPTRGSAHPRRHTAVAAVLGGEMHEQLVRRGGDHRGDVDVEALLRGAEKLCGVYELPGARERIAALRAKFRNGRNTTAYYEKRVAEQAEQLASMNRDWMRDEEEEVEEVDGEDESQVWTEEDLRREEKAAREMEAKKMELQGSLRAMEKDLGALMDM